jgi:CheY-like chemotaxis protein
MAKVMIVDDSGTVRRYMAQMVELANHSASTAESGEKAIALLEEYTRKDPALLPDLIFMDVLMSPGMSGIEVTQKIKAHPNPTIAEIPIVILTGIGEQDVASEALDAGALDYMVKPSSTEALSSFLDNLRKKLEKLLHLSARSLKKGAGLIADLTNENLPSLLQMLHLESASGYVTLTNPRNRQSASMHLRYGNIEHLVLVDNSKGVKKRLEGEEAFHTLINWPEGTFSFGRANPERMPKGKPLNLVALLAAVDIKEVGDKKFMSIPSQTPVALGSRSESYQEFKANLEKELLELLKNVTANQLFYMRIKNKPFALLKVIKSDTQKISFFKNEKDFLDFIQKRTSDFANGKFVEISFFFEKGYINIRHIGRADYIVLLDPDQERAKEGRLVTAQAATIIRKAVVERRNKRSIAA